MVGAAVFFRVPSSTGWRVLRGTITHINESAIVVREKFFGGQSTIHPNWLVMYDWTEKQTTPMTEVISA